MVIIIINLLATIIIVSESWCVDGERQDVFPVST